MKDFEGKSRRLRERIKLALPVRVQCRESVGHEWSEMSRLVDVTPFGARFQLLRPTERGRLLHLTLPMPRQLRCFDHIEDQYRVWALVRHVMPRVSPGEPLRFEVGAAFTGKHPPPSYMKDPATRYDVGPLTAEGGLYGLRELDEAEQAAAPGGGQAARSVETRLQMAVNVIIEVFDSQGRPGEREQTVTENISRRGAAVWTSLKVERGRFLRVTDAATGLSVIAAVRGRRNGPDGIPRLHLQFLDRQWPLDGIE